MLIFIRSIDNTVTENLTDIFQSNAINAELELLIKSKFKIIKVGLFYR